MLAVSGRLNPQRGGPSVIVPIEPELLKLVYNPAQWAVNADSGQFNRRSIYLFQKRNLRLPFMEVFDSPDLLLSCPRREMSTHAPQALELLNGDFSNTTARWFAERVEREAEPAALPTTGEFGEPFNWRWGGIPIQPNARPQCGTLRTDL